MRDGDPALVWYGGLYCIASAADSVAVAASWSDLSDRDLHHERHSLVAALDTLTWHLERGLRVDESEALLAAVLRCLRLVDERRLDELAAELAVLCEEVVRLGYVRNAWPGEDWCIGYPDGGIHPVDDA